MASTGEDIWTFRHIYDDLYPGFVRFAYSYVRDHAVAEDIVAESIIYYWERRNSYSSELNVPAYILTAVKHKCLNHLRHQAIKEESSDELKNYQQWELSTRISTLKACDPEELFTSEIIEIVNDTLARMPERARRVFIMGRMENMSRSEIAEALGISPKGVDFHMNKALKMLRKSLKDYYVVMLGIEIMKHCN